MIRQKITSLDKPLVIFICGAPGTRKSSVAIQLAAKLGIKTVIGTDQLRDALKLYVYSPFLTGPTHNRWQLIGGRTPENIAKGYLLQSVLLKRPVLEILQLSQNRGENMIVEGVHLLPELYQELKDDSRLKFFHFLLLAENEAVHARNINLKVRLRHGKEKEWPKEKMEDIREMQKFLLESRPSYVHLIDANSVSGKVKEVMKILEESL